MTTGFWKLAKPGVESLPAYEPGRPIEDVAREQGFADAGAIVKLASNENALGPSPRALAAMRECAGRMHRYPDGGTIALRQALAGHLDVGPDCILPGNGSNELIELLAHAFIAPGQGIVMAEYAFIVYRLVAPAFNAPLTTVPMRDFTHDLGAMAAAISPDTRLVFIANPNNPTGTRVPAADIDDFMARVPDHVVVCFDEAYVELLEPEDQPDTLRYVREGRNVAVLRTFSKAYGLAGLRLGYAIAPPACIALLNRVRQPFNVNAMAQVAAIAALDDQEHVRASRRLAREGLATFAADLDRVGLPYVPSCANFMLIKVGDGQRAYRALMREGVIVRPMDVYRLPEYVRVTIGTPAEMTRLREALGKVLGELRP